MLITPHKVTKTLSPNNSSSGTSNIQNKFNFKISSNVLNAKMICPESGKKRKELVQSPNKKDASSGDHNVLSKFQSATWDCYGNFG